MINWIPYKPKNPPEFRKTFLITNRNGRFCESGELYPATEDHHQYWRGSFGAEMKHVTHYAEFNMPGEGDETMKIKAGNFYICGVGKMELHTQQKWNLTEEERRIIGEYTDVLTDEKGEPYTFETRQAAREWMRDNIKRVHISQADVLPVVISREDYFIPKRPVDAGIILPDEVIKLLRDAMHRIAKDVEYIHGDGSPIYLPDVYKNISQYLLKIAKEDKA